MTGFLSLLSDSLPTSPAYVSRLIIITQYIRGREGEGDSGELVFDLQAQRNASRSPPIY